MLAREGVARWVGLEWEGVQLEGETFGVAAREDALLVLKQRRGRTKMTARWHQARDKQLMLRLMDTIDWLFSD